MPKTETIQWGGRTWRRYPDSKRRNHRVYFQRHDKWKGPVLYLHREIWSSVHGVIPKGSHVHHKDENPLNNDIGNLECVTSQEHRKRHSGKCTDAMRSNLNAIRPKAAEWHRSDEGREWHRLHANGVRDSRKDVFYEHKCERCGKDYKSKYAIGRACTKLCYERLRVRKPVHEKTCGHCGKGFMGMRKDSKYCGRSCAGFAQ